MLLPRPRWWRYKQDPGRAEGLLRILSMHAREAVERQAYPGQSNSLSDSTQQKTYGDQKNQPLQILVAVEVGIVEFLV